MQEYSRYRQKQLPTAISNLAFNSPNHQNPTITTQIRRLLLSLPPPTRRKPLLASFTSFLTIAIHSLLYHRRLYPETSFLAARAYNLPVRQSRHPGLCAWISDAVAAVAVQLRAGAVRRIVLAVHSPAPQAAVRERWVFDVHRFPAWGEAETDAPTSHQQPQQQQQQEEDDDEPMEEDVEDVADEKLNWADIHEALRAALQRLAYAAQGAPKLPQDAHSRLL
ncbi:hypothetical protein TrVFT333_007763 [Trichoderma virens FT-333]|nr:hypothetical protein TrVFT333_007763 [Trichoderma virens FT-333]